MQNGMVDPAFNLLMYAGTSDFCHKDVVATLFGDLTGPALYCGHGVLQYRSAVGTGSEWLSTEGIAIHFSGLEEGECRPPAGFYPACSG